jgi:DNA-binding XRE family transcriptional regulator
MIEPQIIESDGQPAFVVLPYAEWRRIEELLEDASDNAALEAFRADAPEVFPISVADALIAGQNPVRVFRHHRKLTLKALSAKAGIAVGYLSQIETGKREPSLSVARSLADALGVTVDDLV